MNKKEAKELKKVYAKSLEGFAKRKDKFKKEIISYFEVGVRHKKNFAHVEAWVFRVGSVEEAVEKYRELSGGDFELISITLAATPELLSVK